MSNFCKLRSKFWETCCPKSCLRKSGARSNEGVSKLYFVIENKKTHLQPVKNVLITTDESITNRSWLMKYYVDDDVKEKDTTCYTTKLNGKNNMMLLKREWVALIQLLYYRCLESIYKVKVCSCFQ